MYSQDIVEIIDPDFKNALISVGVDTNSDGEIQQSEAEEVDSLNFSNYSFRFTTGLTSFINLRKITIRNNINLRSVELQDLNLLEYIWITDNRHLKSIELLNNPVMVKIAAGNNDSLRILNLEDSPNLETLTIFSNHPSLQIEVSHLTNLHELVLINHDFEAIEPDKYPLLERLYLSGYSRQKALDLNTNTNLTELILSSCDSLQSLQFEDLINLESINFSSINAIQNLDLKEYQKLTNLNLRGNDLLESIQLNGLVQLTDVNIYNNDLLEELDLSDQINLEDFSQVQYNDALKRLFIKNGKHDRLDLKKNPNLEIVCVDEIERFFIESKLHPDNIPFDIITSFCPYTSEGNPYILSGQVKYDYNNDGCDSDDIAVPYPKFHISNNTEEGFVYGNKNGRYSILLGEGDFTVEPLLDPTYSHFKFSPEILELTFPDSITPFPQDFCITPDGEYHDLEVVLIPQDQARPGFESSYKIIIRNVGNTIIPFDLTLLFQSELMDYVSSSVAIDDFGVGTLTWHFDEIKPFEEKTIELTFELNTPTEDPSLNDGDILHFIAKVEIDQTDEQPSNNTRHLFQTVVNSFDPNDKTCLEGTILSPDMIGDFVHYRIRFENLGTAEATHIVVKDAIDTSSFKINTLQIIDASHELETRITKGIVAFIFKDINLPFEDESNDGYVVFKIKTKDDLGLGNTLSNTAEIYFDFNPPIVTNTTLTTFQDVFSDNDLDGFTSDIDCDDTNPLINPDSEEVCDNIDNNCDGSVDEDLEFTTYYIDSDNDEYGDDQTATDYCNEQADLVILPGDCDDSNNDIYPGAEEIPNNDIDEDCDGFDLITGVHEFVNSTIRIFPNPVHDVLYFDVAGQLDYSFSLYDLAGQIIVANTNQKSLTVNSIPSGIYLLELKDQKTGQRIVEKIVIGK